MPADCVTAERSDQVPASIRPAEGVDVQTPPTREYTSYVDADNAAERAPIESLRRETVLVLGFRSFIGQYVCRQLLERGYLVRAQTSARALAKDFDELVGHPWLELWSFDIDDEIRLREALRGVAYLVQCGFPTSIAGNRRRSAFEERLRATQTLFSMAAEHELKKAVFVSTPATIGRRLDGQLDERLSRTKHDRLHLQSKLIRDVETEVLEAARRGLPAVVVNPTVLIGEKDTKPSTGELFRLAKRARFRALSSQPFNLVRVEDAATGVVLAMERGESGERYLLGGTDTSFGAFLDRARVAMDLRPRRISLPDVLTRAFSYLSEAAARVAPGRKPLLPRARVDQATCAGYTSSDKARRELGYEPRSVWPELERAADWYLRKRKI